MARLREYTGRPLFGLVGERDEPPWPDAVRKWARRYEADSNRARMTQIQPETTGEGASISVGSRKVSYAKFSACGDRCLSFLVGPESFALYSSLGSHDEA